MHARSAMSRVPRVMRALLLAAAAALLIAQGRFGGGRGRILPNAEYDGRFVFTRVWYPGIGRRGSAWDHDYPRADHHLPKIMREISTLDPQIDVSNVFELSDPELFRNPVLYLSEPGTWGASEVHVRALGAYLLKGGFLIVDDFEADQWINFEGQMRRALPEHEPIVIDETHPIFDTFFRVDDPYVPHPLVRVTPRFVGWFEDNDPMRRMMVLANHNSDLAEYWEFSGTGTFPVDLTNEAYKLGANYIIYGMTR